MTTFDEIIPKVASVLNREEEFARLPPMLVNRDLNGRVRLIVDERWEEDASVRPALDRFATMMRSALALHAFPAPGDMILFESAERIDKERAASFPLNEAFPKVRVIDRLVADSDWGRPDDVPESGAPRIVFFSIKGGVGRSTALAATAWSLAEGGKRVLVIDLDLESPGLSSSLLPEDRRPTFGVTDWLVEDLVDNGKAVFADMTATSELSRNGEILVVPAHGRDPGNYVAKLGRIWMPKVSASARETWPARLGRLVDALEGHWKPDVILIDSRAGIDEIASACLTNLRASLIALFAIDGDQTWTGYRVLFRHWRTIEAATRIRGRLQVVGAMIPEVGTAEYFDGLRERAWSAFSDELYDEIPPGELSGGDDRWNFDKFDDLAPHYPWGIRWNRGFAALRDLRGRLREVDPGEVKLVFGPLADGISAFVEDDRSKT